MIADLKPYPAMKDSGVEWLWEVPEHWDVVPLCAIAKTKSIIDQQDRELLSVYLNLGVIRFSDVKEKRTNVTSEDLSKYQAVDPGDFVLNNQQAWRGSVGVSRYTGIVSPAYLVLSLNSRINSEFANLLFRERGMVAQYLIASKGVGSIQRNLYWPHLKRITTFLPPLPEQASIVRYLEHVNRRVRRLVLAKRKLIALLTEQKQAIIHHTVTRGLDPNVPLKDSGVKWLGEVPEHWQVWQLGHFCRIGNGSTPSRGNISYWADGHYPWLNSSYANEDTVMKADQFVTAVALEECHLPIVPSGSLLVAITGQGKTRGKAVMLSIEATINQHLAYITPKTPIASSRYLQRIFDGAYGHLRSISDDSGSTKGALTCGDLKHFRVALPAGSEQASIVEYLDHATADIDTAITRAHREIELLNEYRTRLIADVVAGKLDVREAAANLPEEPGEPEPLDETDELMGVDEAIADDLDTVPEEAEA